MKVLCQDNAVIAKSHWRHHYQTFIFKERESNH